MGDDGKKTLTPKLRFPEFWKDDAWRATPLSELCVRIVEKVGDAKLTPVSITAGRGFVSQAEKFGRDISGAQYKNYIYLRHGEFAYNKGNSNLYPQGCVYRLKEFDEAAASNAFICFRLKDGNASGFFEGLFEKNAHGRQLIRFLTSGARSDGLLNIKPEEFFSVEFPIPPRVAEQQKIADCLTSLDELIAAQGRKVEALKAHKKGLMQQLFPREGETLPPLRFPEFRDPGEWKEMRIADLKPFVTSGSRGWAAYYAESGSLFVRITNLSRESIFLDLSDTKYVDLPPDATEGVRTQLKHHDILVSVTADIGMIGYVDADIPSPAYINQHIALVRFTTAEVHSRFVAYFLASETSQRRFMAATDNGTKAGMNLMAVQSIPLALPSPAEQQRIADCLSALDARLTAESRKLDALKFHKRGLMQQLFPSAEGN